MFYKKRDIIIKLIMFIVKIIYKFRNISYNFLKYYYTPVKR